MFFAKKSLTAEAMDQKNSSLSLDRENLGRIRLLALALQDSDGRPFHRRYPHPSDSFLPYIDEFQNFGQRIFAVILSEARNTDFPLSGPSDPVPDIYGTAEFDSGQCRDTGIFPD